MNFYPFGLPTFPDYERITYERDHVERMHLRALRRERRTRR